MKTKTINTDFETTFREIDGSKRWNALSKKEKLIHAVGIVHEVITEEDMTRFFKDGDANRPLTFLYSVRITSAYPAISNLLIIITEWLSIITFKYQEGLQKAHSHFIDRYKQIDIEKLFAEALNYE